MVGKKLTLELKNRLEKAGLFVSEPYPESHSLSLGVIVGKPISTLGNSIKNFRTAVDEVEMDAPDITLFFRDGKWIVMGQEGVPVPGPGDFTNYWLTAEEAVQDILDFYLGNSSRMQVKEKAQQEVQDKIDKFLQAKEKKEKQQ